MSDSEKIVLSDSNVKPDDLLIASILKSGIDYWRQLHIILKNDFPGSEGVWNYYKDGKQWLYKMQFKKKTLFWSSLIEGGFRITFYFADKAEPLISSSSLISDIKEQFAVSKKYGAVRGVSIIVKSNKDIEQILILAGIKVKLK